jgi:hypothetical protein
VEHSLYTPEGSSVTWYYLLQTATLSAAHTTQVVLDSYFVHIIYIFVPIYRRTSCMHVCMYVCMYVYIYIYVCIYIVTY